MSELRSRRFVYDRIVPHGSSVRVFGDAPIVVGRGTSVVNGGMVFELVCAEVYAKPDREWKLVSLHACSDSV